MKYTPDKKYMVMNLKDGVRYEELDENKTSSRARNHPHLRMKFKT